MAHPYKKIHYSFIIYVQGGQMKLGGGVIGRGGGTSFSREPEGGGRVTFSVADKFHLARV